MAGVCLQYGRPHGWGSVFSLSGIRPFVETIPPAGKVGDVITILGNNLTGATSVTFGFEGKPAKFSVVSDNEISATIPEGGCEQRCDLRVHGQLVAPKQRCLPCFAVTYCREVEE